MTTVETFIGRKRRFEEMTEPELLSIVRDEWTWRGVFIVIAAVLLVFWVNEFPTPWANSGIDLVALGVLVLVISENRSSERLNAVSCLLDRLSRPVPDEPTGPGALLRFLRPNGRP